MSILPKLWKSPGSRSRTVTYVHGPNILMSPRPGISVPKVRSKERQFCDHLRYGILDPPLELKNQNLYFTKIPWWFRCRLKFEKNWHGWISHCLSCRDLDKSPRGMLFWSSHSNYLKWPWDDLEVTLNDQGSLWLPLTYHPIWLGVGDAGQAEIVSLFSPTLDPETLNPSFRESLETWRGKRKEKLRNWGRK